MKAEVRLLLWIGLLASVPAGLRAQEEAAEPELAVEPTACAKCHGEPDLWEGETLRLYVTTDHLKNDIHWQKGLRCHDCHGGDSETTNFLQAHSEDAGFRSVKTASQVPAFCGHCHSDVEYMTRYQPSPNTTQETDYWTSGHGKRLKETGDEKVANCISCHGGHGILAIDDLASPVYPVNVAKTCATCHSDAEQMADRQYHGRPMGHDQFQLWSQSVHAQAMSQRGDLSAATCNDCHGNHGTVAPNATAVSNACGNCHARVGQLVAETQMVHSFEKFALPGCATCHGNHDIRHPTDAMLGMTEGAVCADCHEKGKFGATLAGNQQAREMRTSLENLKSQIALANARVAEAEKLGMEVRGPNFDLHKAHASLTNARTLIHTFSYPPVKEAIDEGLEITAQVNQRALDAIDEHTNRRVWLGVSLVPILFVILLLLAYIRQLPVPSQESVDPH